jgi:hypothetical protein
MLLATTTSTERGTVKNEVRTIRSLRERNHIIQVFATYVATGKFGLILRPVVDEGSLDNYLGRYSSAAK